MILILVTIINLLKKLAQASWWNAICFFKRDWAQAKRNVIVNYLAKTSSTWPAQCQSESEFMPVRVRVHASQSQSSCQLTPGMCMISHWSHGWSPTLFLRTCFILSTCFKGKFFICWVLGGDSTFIVFEFIISEWLEGACEQRRGREELEGRD